MPNQSESEFSVADHPCLGQPCDHNRRRMLKALAAIMGGGTVAPALAGRSPVASVTEHTNNETQIVDLPGQIEFRFVDSKSIPGMTALGQGTIINRSAIEIWVTDITPAVMITDNGHYDVSAYLAENPALLASGQQHHFWVRPLHLKHTSHENRRQHKMHGSLSPLNSQRTPVLALIDNPSIGVAAVKQPFELTITASIPSNYG